MILKKSRILFEKIDLNENIDFNILPSEKLKELATRWNVSLDSKQFCFILDQLDPMKKFRQKFIIPKRKTLPNIDLKLLGKNAKKKCIYLCGQSLGLMPIKAKKNLNKVLNDWSKLGVYMHEKGYLPAAFCDLPPKKALATLVGANESEIAVMNGLTVNLHILFSTFYKPTATKHKILIEKHAFSSDMFAVESQIRFHGYDVKTSLLTFDSKKDEYIIDEEDIMKLIDQEKDSIAVVLLPGLHYYTGQLFDVQKLTQHAHKYNIIVGLNCAHFIGNVELKLKEWDVDFAAWCTYKYLCTGPGGIGCIFVNDKFTKKECLTDTMPMLKGWWGNNVNTKFLFNGEFDPCEGADMFKISNPPPLLVAPLMASLKIFLEANMKNMIKKQYLITGYLEYLLENNFCTDEKKILKIITPKDIKKRGSQLSIIFSCSLENVLKELQRRGIVCDIRLPNVMRLTPVVLYNSYQDVYEFVSILKEILIDKNIN